jgi:hypothetical protein
MRNVLVGLTLVAVLLSPIVSLGVVAEGQEGAKKPHKERPAPIDLTLTGKVEKKEREGKEGQKAAHYVLVDEQGGKVMLPSGHKRHGKEKAEGVAMETAIDLEQYVGQTVTVTGKGFRTEREGKEVTRLVRITKIEAAGEPAAE